LPSFIRVLPQIMIKCFWIKSLHYYHFWGLPGLLDHLAVDLAELLRISIVCFALFLFIFFSACFAYEKQRCWRWRPFCCCLVSFYHLSFCSSCALFVNWEKKVITLWVIVPVLHLIFGIFGISKNMYYYKKIKTFASI